MEDLVVKSQYGTRRIRQVECCGHVLVCDGFTNTCQACSRDYDMQGNQLAPRSQWDGTDGATSPGYE